MQNAEKDDSMNSDEENADASSPTKKRRKTTASDERRERVQALFEDLTTKHGLLILAHSTDCGPKQ